MSDNQNRTNKDLILRERLAIDRTDMANDRTLLSFIRTALYFSIAGMTVNSLLQVNYGKWVEIVFWILSVLILVTGLIKFRQQKKKIVASKKQVGNYKLEIEDDMD
jgi:putative membrane protein